MICLTPSSRSGASSPSYHCVRSCRAVDVPAGDAIDHETILGARLPRLEAQQHVLHQQSLGRQTHTDIRSRAGTEYTTCRSKSRPAAEQRN